MPIDKSTVVIGGRYRTKNNQHRVVVGCDVNCNVIYAFCGGTVGNLFYAHESCLLDKFANGCSEKLCDLTDGELKEIIKTCQAKGEIVSESNCCLEKREGKTD